MKNDVTRPQGHDLALPANFVEKLSSGIAESRATTIIAGGGKPLLRLLKSGEWVFGPSDEAVQEGSRWVVNLLTLAHGWSCWVDMGPGRKNELRGEVMTSMADPKPLRPPPIENTPFAEQRAFELKCLTGDDAETEVIYKSGSIGGMRAIDNLLVEIQKQLATDPGHAFPVLDLGCDYYEHNKWGRIYTPVLTLVGWVDGNGQSVDEAVGRSAPAPELEPKPAPPTKPRKPSLKATAAPQEPVSTQQAHTGQRRRPGAR
jgi:hypothetical protein